MTYLLCDDFSFISGPRFNYNKLACLCRLCVATAIASTLGWREVCLASCQPRVYPRSVPVAPVNGGLSMFPLLGPGHGVERRRLKPKLFAKAR